MRPREASPAQQAGFALAVLAFAFVLFGGLSRPLLWNDEAFTAVYAERVIEFGYPKVHSERNVVYALDAPLSVGVKEESDAYIGSLWGQYYFGALGVWLSRLSDDLYTRTAWMRLPFALAGVAGLACFLAALWPLYGDPWQRWQGAIAFVFGCVVSVSLVLHLREARYYALVVLGVGALVWLFRAREVSGTLRLAPYVAGVIAALAGLSVCYYPAAVVCANALAIDGLLRLRRDALEHTWQRLLPILVAAALGVPLALYFEVPRMASVLTAAYDTSLSTYLESLRTVALHLLRFEWLAPLLAVRALLLWKRADDEDEAQLQRRRLSRFLLAILVVYVLLVGRTPYFFERYFVVLGPVTLALLQVDLRRLYGRLSSFHWKGPAGAFALVLALSFFPRALDLQQRIREIVTPVEGPLDAVIPYLAEHYPDPRELVIATNYEDPAYVWYLGSQVIVGFNAPALERDRGIAPDVVVPRLGRRHRDVLAEMLRAGSFERRSFPVYDSPTNNLPSLSPDTAGGNLHRFRTRRPERPERAVVIFERRGSSEKAAPPGAG